MYRASTSFCASTSWKFEKPRTPGFAAQNAESIAGAVSHAATIRGLKSSPTRWFHRAAADANSRPISPHPITPKLMTRSLIVLSSASLENRHRLLGRCVVVDESHQRARHPRGIRVLDDVSTIDNPACSLAHHFEGSPEDLLVRRAPPAAHENGNAGGRLDHLAVHRDVLGGVGLDDVRPHLDGLSHQRDDLLRVPVNAV